jgi:hypothetical protein
MSDAVNDRDAIVELLAEAAWIFDHKQWDRIGEVFTSDTEAYEQQGIEALTANTIRYLGGCGPTQHLIGNHRVQVDGHTATVISYVRAFHLAAGVGRMDRARPDQFWDFLGEYRDTLVRTPDGWRISRRVCVPRASTGALDLLAGS